MSSPFRSDAVAGKVLFVTGGGTGIGFEICQTLGQHGAKIAMMGRRQEKLDEAVAALKKLGVEAIGIQGDVRDHTQCQNAVDAVIHHYGQIDILVNNAAGNFMCSAEELTPNGFKTVIEIDLQGCFFMSKACFPHLKNAQARGGGLIINITATLQYTAMPFQVHAASAKAGIDVLTNTLGLEWGEYGIRVVGIAPGPIAGTVGGPGGRVFGLAGFLEGDDVKQVVPIGRYGTTRDVAMAALFLSTNAASFISSTTIVVDGGQWHGKAAMYQGLKPHVSRKKDAEKKTEKQKIVKAKL